MGQQEVYQFLRQYPDKWFTSKEIGKEINLPHHTVNVALRRLRTYREIDYEEYRNPSIAYRYRFLTGGS